MTLAAPRSHHRRAHLAQIGRGIALVWASSDPFMSQPMSVLGLVADVRRSLCASEDRVFA